MTDREPKPDLLATAPRDIPLRVHNALAADPQIPAIIREALVRITTEICVTTQRALDAASEAGWAPVSAALGDSEGVQREP